MVKPDTFSHIGLCNLPLEEGGEEERVMLIQNKFVSRSSFTLSSAVGYARLAASTKITSKKEHKGYHPRGPYPFVFSEKDGPGLSTSSSVTLLKN